MKEIRELLKKYNIHADKGLSQNFLIDRHVTQRIIKAAEPDMSTVVIEIGSGLGSLTGELLKAAGKVIAIELDKRLCDILREEHGADNLTIINADVMKADLNEIAAREAFNGFKIKVCANLPYHITTPVTMRLLEEARGIESLTLMMQKEVADRMLSEPGTKSYGAITPAVNYYSKPALIANVPPHCFIPRPNVCSAVVLFEIRRQRPVFPKSEKLMFSIIKASFGQRRKTIYNAISNQIIDSIGIGRESLLECLSSHTMSDMGIRPQTRGEDLGLAEFSALSDVIYEAVRERRKNSNENYDI